MRVRKDYHMHPMVIQAPERFDEFVQSALRKNIGEICITDHMPLSLSDAPDRIPSGSVGEYCARVRELAKRYEGIISIKCGIEIDYHPSVMDEVERALDAGDFDFVLGSSHMQIFVSDYSKYSFNDFAKLALENSIRAAESGLFSAIAHPDMYRWTFERPKRFPMVDDGYTPLRHEGLIRELLSAVSSRGMLLEINPHLADSKKDLFYMYPQDTILSWALETGVRCSYGSDAHAPGSVGALLDELEVHPLYGTALDGWENE